MNMEITNGNLKSVKLTRKERNALRKWVGEQPTKLIAAERLDVAPGTLDRVMLAGSGAPDTIEKIKTALAA